MFIIVSLFVLWKHSVAGHVNTSRLISVSMLCRAAAQTTSNDSFHNTFTSCLTRSECMYEKGGRWWGEKREKARQRERTHRSVGLLYEFLLPHLQAALSLLQLLLFSAQVPLQLLQAIQSRLDLPPSHKETFHKPFSLHITGALIHRNQPAHQFNNHKHITGSKGLLLPVLVTCFIIIPTFLSFNNKLFLLLIIMFEYPWSIHFC